METPRSAQSFAMIDLTFRVSRNEVEVTPVSNFRRPRWRDPRLGVGVLLVAVSVALGGWVFAQADKTVPVYQVKEPVAVGEALKDAPLELINVNLSGMYSSYLTAEDVDELAIGESESVFIRAVPAGELLPRSALGSSSDLQLRPVSINVTNPTPLEVGSVADLWVMVEDVTGREVSEPELVASGLHVRGVEDDESLFAAASGNVVHVLVPEDDVGQVLAALGSKSSVTLVPHLGG